MSLLSSFFWAKVCTLGERKGLMAWLLGLPFVEVRLFNWLYICPRFRVLRWEFSTGEK